jgi:hypothetical protein
VDELRKDPTRGQWVLIRPKAEVAPDGPCPFCPGAEHLTGGEIAAYRKEGSLANSSDWTVRVVPEPDAYFRVERELIREGVGMFDMITSRGASELIIESPRHDDTPATMPLEQMEAVLWMYRDRLLDLKRDGQIRDIMISRRHRKPGVPEHHPYSRVTAIPIVFDETRRELREAREYYQYKRRCLYCDILRLLLRGLADGRLRPRSGPAARRHLRRDGSRLRRSRLRDGAAHGAEPPLAHPAGRLGDDPRRLSLAHRDRGAARAHQSAGRDLRQRDRAGGDRGGAAGGVAGGLASLGHLGADRQG